jgi:nitric oxide reductase large subunit
MSKQTAVEWLINELHRKQNGCGSKLSFNQIFDKAKEMEKEQVKLAFNQGYRESEIDNKGSIIVNTGLDITDYKDSENYYTQTYGGK